MGVDRREKRIYEKMSKMMQLMIDNTRLNILKLMEMKLR